SKDQEIETLKNLTRLITHRWINDLPETAQKKVVPDPITNLSENDGFTSNEMLAISTNFFSFLIENYAFNKEETRIECKNTVLLEKHKKEQGLTIDTEAIERQSSLSINPKRQSNLSLSVIVHLPPLNNTHVISQIVSIDSLLTPFETALPASPSKSTLTQSVPATIKPHFVPPLESVPIPINHIQEHKVKSSDMLVTITNSRVLKPLPPELVPEPHETSNFEIFVKNNSKTVRSKSQPPLRKLEAIGYKPQGSLDSLNQETEGTVLSKSALNEDVTHYFPSVTDLKKSGSISALNHLKNNNQMISVDLMVARKLARNTIELQIK
ncbi:hypothetical protein HK096_006869, partial [Nowakowskiella sp. JEL0078]